jgi:hypothetical protein
MVQQQQQHQQEQLVTVATIPEEVPEPVVLASNETDPAA